MIERLLEDRIKSILELEEISTEDLIKCYITVWAEKEEMNFPSRPYILKVMYADECREITVCRCKTEEEAFKRARDFEKETEDRVYFRIDKDE